MDLRIKRRIINKLNEIANNQYEKQLQGMQKLITTAAIHSKTFLEYKGCFSGKKVVIVGAGPTLNKYKRMDDCIHIGLNSACKRTDLNFDFLFTIDRIGIENIYSDFAAVDCVKFIGDQDLGPAFQIPESWILKTDKIRRYKTDAGLYNRSSFAFNLESQPLGNFNTVSLQAAQFALYTNPAAIYLVGIDCTPKGHFDSTEKDVSILRNRLSSRGENLDIWSNDTTNYWKDFKSFAQTYYPDTKIISINPVGLKGVFEDIYTNSQVI